MAVRCLLRAGPSPRLSLLSGLGPVSQKPGSVRTGPGEKTGPWLRLAVGHRREDPDPVESRDTSDDTGRHIGPVQARPGLREQGTVVSSNLSSVLYSHEPGQHVEDLCSLHLSSSSSVQGGGHSVDIDSESNKQSVRSLVFQNIRQLNKVQPEQFSFRFYRFSKREWDGLVCARVPRIWWMSVIRRE